jgi:hypothetical protein
LIYFCIKGAGDCYHFSFALSTQSQQKYSQTININDFALYITKAKGYIPLGLADNIDPPETSFFSPFLRENNKKKKKS